MRLFGTKQNDQLAGRLGGCLTDRLMTDRRTNKWMGGKTGWRVDGQIDGWMD